MSKEPKDERFVRLAEARVDLNKQDPIKWIKTV